MTMPIVSRWSWLNPCWQKFGLGVLAMVLLLTGASLSARANEYLLGPQDKIRIKVYEWRASRDDIFEWKALNDIFTVGPDGMVSLPFAGAVRAQDRTAIEFGQEVGERLKQQMQLSNAPDTSVEIVQFRPVYVVGNVVQPGQFPYAPDLTVLQAVALAGGLRTQQEGFATLAHQVVSEQGDVNVFGLNTLALLARKARLEAEHTGADHIQFPKELTSREDVGLVSMVMQQEQSIFEARREGLKNQTKALESLRQTLTAELTSLQGQLVFHDKQLDLIQKELSSISSLVDKGIVAAPRQISLERELAQFQGSRLAAETSMLRSRQEISRTDISILDLKNRYDNEVVVSLRDTQSQLDELAAKTKTAVALLQNSRMTASGLFTVQAGIDQPEPIYTVIRPGKNGKESEIAASEGTALHPGDTIKVEIKTIPGLDGFDPSVIGPMSGGPMSGGPMSGQRKSVDDAPGLAAPTQ